MAFPSDTLSVLFVGVAIVELGCALELVVSGPTEIGGMRVPTLVVVGVGAGAGGLGVPIDTDNDGEVVG